MPEEQQVSREGSGGGNAEPSCRVYVGNLSWRVRWQDLKDHMKQAGEVVRADVFEDFQGKSKGCGIVQYENAEGAQKAIKELTDSELFDRLIFVREDREDEHRLPGGRRGGYGSSYFFRGPRYYIGSSWRGRRGTAYRSGYRGGYRGGSSSSGRVKEEEGRETHGAGGGAGGSGAPAAGSSSSTSSGRVASSSSSSNAYNRYGRGGLYGSGGGNVYGFGAGRGGRRPSGRGGFRGGTRGGSFGGYGGYRGGRGGYAGGGGPPPAGGECAGRQIFVSNLPWRTSWQDLKDLFRECGDVVRADVMTMPDGRSKGVGTVLFASPEGADRAVQMFNEYMLDGRPILVRIDRVA